MPRIVLAIGLLAIVSGCIPFPHMETLAPSVSGTLTEDGVAVSGAVIHYFAYTNFEADPCRVSEVTAVTGDQGEFFIKEHRELEILFVPMADRLYLFTVCAERGGSFELLWQEGDFGTLRKDLAIRCDLTDPLVETDKGRRRCLLPDETSLGE